MIKYTINCSTTNNTFFDSEVFKLEIAFIVHVIIPITVIITSKNINQAIGIELNKLG